MATYSSILAWRIPTDRGDWWATVREVAELDTTAQLTLTLSWNHILLPGKKTGSPQYSL